MGCGAGHLGPHLGSEEGLLTCPFCWGHNPEASLSEVALFPLGSLFSEGCS